MHKMHFTRFSFEKLSFKGKSNSLRICTFSCKPKESIKMTHFWHKIELSNVAPPQKKRKEDITSKVTGMAFPTREKVMKIMYL